MCSVALVERTARFGTGRVKYHARLPFVVVDPTDSFDEASGHLANDEIDDVPRVSCSRCDREWDLAYELDELSAGNHALFQFALDHERHTGHYPDDVRPWIVSCRRCPDGEIFLSERPARRWAEAHARHTRHAVTIEHASDTGDAERTVVEPDTDDSDVE